MARNVTSGMNFPPFRGAVRQLIILSTAIYVVLLLFQAFAASVYLEILKFAILAPGAVFHGQIWRLFTYTFIQDSPFNFFMSMLGMYFIGGAVEDQIRGRKFWELFLVAQIGSATVGVLLSLLGISQGGAVGSGPAANAMLMVFYMFYRDARVMPMFIPIPIPIKFIVIFTAAIEAAYLLLTHFSMFYMVQLLGLGMGYVWYNFGRRTSALGLLSLKFAEMQNGYYRWKRRRAGRKFEVYMRKHEHDPKQYFDEYGNFKPPDDKDKKDKGGSGWVN
jgi:membrane associated rhomboid family serine protease